MAVVVDNCAVRKHGASCKRFRDISFLGSWRVKERFLFAMMCWEDFWKKCQKYEFYIMRTIFIYMYSPI